MVSSGYQSAPINVFSVLYMNLLKNTVDENNCVGYSNFTKEEWFENVNNGTSHVLPCERTLMENFNITLDQIRANKKMYYPNIMWFDGRGGTQLLWNFMATYSRSVSNCTNYLRCIRTTLLTLVSRQKNPENRVFLEI